MLNGLLFYRNEYSNKKKGAKTVGLLNLNAVNCSWMSVYFVVVLAFYVFNDIKFFTCCDNIYNEIYRKKADSFVKQFSLVKFRAQPLREQ